MTSLTGWFGRLATDWLTREGLPPPVPSCDFERLGYELRPADVILVEGRSRVADVIRLTTQSPWTHAALYIGRLYDIRDVEVRQRVAAHFNGDPEEQLVIEALLGQGTIISPLSSYRHHHLRICRPDGLAHADAQKVVGYAAGHLGWAYDVRQILDLARFFFPWTVMPRRWRSSLFEHNAGDATRVVCSTLLAEAFGEVDFPILPFIDHADDGSLRFFKRNPRLFAPRDFDYSPYFDIIKYPFLGVSDLSLYRRLPWSSDEVLYNDEADDFAPPADLQSKPEPAPVAATADERGALHMTHINFLRQREG